MRLIERLAREANLGPWESYCESPVSTSVYWADLERFAALVANECARVAESRQSTDTDWDHNYWDQACLSAAAAIRAAFPMPKG